MLGNPPCVMKDLAFLAHLNTKLHRIEPCPWYDATRQLTVDHYTDERLTVQELERMIEKIQTDGLAIVPAQLNFGFGVGFRVFWDRPQTCVEGVLSFHEHQLPDGWDFDRLSSVFLSPENVILCREYRLSMPENNRIMYE